MILARNQECEEGMENTSKYVGKYERLVFVLNSSKRLL